MAAVQVVIRNGCLSLGQLESLCNDVHVQCGLVEAPVSTLMGCSGTLTLPLLQVHPIPYSVSLKLLRTLPTGFGFRALS